MVDVSSESGSETWTEFNYAPAHDSRWAAVAEGLAGLADPWGAAAGSDVPWSERFGGFQRDRQMLWGDFWRSIILYTLDPERELPDDIPGQERLFDPEKPVIGS